MHVHVQCSNDHSVVVCTWVHVTLVYACKVVYMYSTATVCSRDLECIGYAVCGLVYSYLFPVSFGMKKSCVNVYMSFNHSTSHLVDMSLVVYLTSSKYIYTSVLFIDL